MPLLTTWKCVLLMDLFNSLLWAGHFVLPPTSNTLHLGCSYHLHSSHRFLSTWGVVMLEKKLHPKWKKKVMKVANESKGMLRKATKVHVYV